MSSFSKIRSTMQSINVDDVDHHRHDDYRITQMYFSQLVYMRWEFVSDALSQMNGYMSHEIFDDTGTQAFFVEFDKTCFLSFRGTESKFNDWKTIFAFWHTSSHSTKVHSGFHNALDKISPSILPLIQVATMKGKQIHYCGHSMGGALATLMCLEYKPTSACVFGSPRLLSSDIYAGFFKSFPFARIENEWDPVTQIPPSIPFLMKYGHVGNLITQPCKFHFIENHYVTTYIQTALEEYNYPLSITARTLNKTR